MRRFYTLFWLALALGWAGLLSAQAVEPFDYPVGEGLAEQDGGTDWTTPWIFRKGADQVTIGEGGIAVPSIGIASHSNHAFTVHTGAGGTRQFRALANPVTDDGGTYYLSWFMDNDYDNPAANGSVHQVMLIDSAALGAGGPGGQLVRMGKIFGTERFGIDGTGVGGAQFINGTDTREAYFVVAKLEMSGNDDPETLSFFYNPTLDTDFATATADLVLSPTLNNGFDALGAKLEGGAPVTGYLDELRFSDTPGGVISENIIRAPGRNIDQFNEYAAGANLDGQDGGLGWGGPWTLLSGDDPEIVEEGIQNFNILRETTGNRVRMSFTGDNGNSRIERPLNTTFQDDGSTYYFSYTSVSTYTSRGQQVDYFMLIDTAAYAATGPGGQLVQIGKNLNTPFIGAGIGGTGNFELTGAEAETPHFVVVKVSTSGNSDPDTVRLYVDPTLDMEPADADATKLIGTNLNNGFNAVGFKVEGLAPGHFMEFDDVMVGVSYDEVIPPDWTELQPLTDAFANDNFNTYAVGDSLPGLDGGSGWGGAWFPFRSTVDSSTIQAAGLVNEPLLVRTSGNSLRMSSAGGNQRIVRLFETPIDTTDNDEFWFSVQMGVEADADNYVGNFMLVDTSIAGGGFQQVILGKPFGNRNLFAGGFGQATGNEPIVPNAFAGNATHWVVGHMTRDTGRWALDVFVNPDFTGDAPDEAMAALINKLYDSGNFNGIAIKAEANLGIDWLIDDIYFGDEFSDVIPPDFTEIPPAPMGAVEKFDYEAGSDYIGQDGGSGWAGPWRLLTEAGGGEIDADEGIASFPLLKATPGPSNRLPVLQRAVRPLDGSYGDFGREFWLGWWAQTENPGNNVVHLVLADTATYAAGGPAGQLAQIGKTFGGTTIGIVAAQGGAAPADVSAAEGHFLVARITTNGGGANDRITLWVDPALDATPSDADAAIVGAADLTNWNAIGFKFEGELGNAVALFDDILLGSPSRAAIQTGLHPARIGMTEHLRGIPPVDPCQPIIPPKNVGRLALAYTTIAEVLDSAGYHTAYVGKWHLGHGANYRPTGHGFDISYAAGGQGLPNSFFPPYFNGNPYPELNTIAGEDTFLSDALTTLAIETLPTDDSPFFLNLNYYAPHVPIMAPADLVAKYEGILGTDPTVLPRPHYAAMVEAVDRQIGRLVDTLTARGLMDNTILMITSDHGPLTVEEVVPFDQHTPPTRAGDLRGGKGMIFEGGLRVPLIAYAPGRYAPAVSAEVNTNTDYFATITALAGVPRTTPDGQPIGTLTGDPAAGPRQLFWHFPHYSPQRGQPAAAIRSGDQKLIEWYSDVDSLYFFHLGLDPGEENNLSDSELQAVLALRDSLADWRGWVGARMPEPNPDYLPENCD